MNDLSQIKKSIVQLSSSICDMKLKRVLLDIVEFIDVNIVTNEMSGKEMIEDGFGSVWSNYCSSCEQNGVLEIVRPGKVQCKNCR